jgi:hypothetical protein
MRFPKKQRVMGSDHLYGWPYVLRNIWKLGNGEGLFFEDSIEQSFTYHYEVIPDEIRCNDWFGMAHVSPTAFRPFTRKDLSEYIDSKPGSQEAWSRLRGICTLSAHLAEQFRQACNKPVVALKYPTNMDVRQFEPSVYLQNPRLVHAGWFAKNMRLLWHIPSTSHIKQKLHVMPPHDHLPHIMECCRQLYPQRAEYDDVDVVKRLHPEDYSKLLYTCVYAAEFTAPAAASTVVVETMARCTPLLVNRHPAVVEYLGKDYPMFFDDVQDCPRLLESDSIIRTHEYLKNMDKGFLSVRGFLTQLKSAHDQWCKP